MSRNDNLNHTTSFCCTAMIDFPEETGRIGLLPPRRSRMTRDLSEGEKHLKPQPCSVTRCNLIGGSGFKGPVRIGNRITFHKCERRCRTCPRATRVPELQHARGKGFHLPRHGTVFSTNNLLLVRTRRVIPQSNHLPHPCAIT